MVVNTDYSLKYNNLLVKTKEYTLLSHYNPQKQIKWRYLFSLGNEKKVWTNKEITYISNICRRWDWGKLIPYLITFCLKWILNSSIGNLQKKLICEQRLKWILVFTYPMPWICKTKRGYVTSSNKAFICDRNLSLTNLNNDMYICKACQYL